MATQSIPPTMRAWTHSTTGSPVSVLKQTTLPMPKITKPNEVLVKVSHTALNPGSSLIVHLVPFMFRTAPQIPDMDFSGSIISTHFNSTHALKTGTKVFGSISPGAHVFKGQGALADYVVVSLDSVYPAPAGMRAEEAAGLGTAGCVSLGFFDIADVKKGDRVLIYGASGGIGSTAVMLAKERVGEEGCVIGVCSRKNAEVVKGLGADEIVAYDEHKSIGKHLAEKYGNDHFDWVFDAYGSQDLWLNCASFLKPSKPYIATGVAILGISWSSIFSMSGKMMSNMLWPRLLGGVDRPYKTLRVVPNAKGMEQIAKLYEEGKLKKMLIDSVWGFDESLKGYEKVLGRHASGKVIIKVEEAETESSK